MMYHRDYSGRLADHLQELDLESRGRLMGAAEPGQMDAFRKVLHEEYDVRTQRSVADEVGRLDHSLREVVSQQVSNVLKEITNRDDTARALEAKLEAQRRMLREEHEAQLRRQAADSETAAKARVEALQAEAMANVDQCQRKAAMEHDRLLEVQNELIAENERLQERIDELGADVYLLRQENTDLCSKQERIEELEATNSEMDSTIVNLRDQLRLEQQAHTQTQRREAAAQQHCQEAAVQLQVKQQEVQTLSADLQAAYSSQQPMTMQLQQLQQQVDSREQQRTQLEEMNANLMDEIGQQQRSLAELRKQADAAVNERDHLQEHLHKVISSTVAERVKAAQSDMQQAQKEKLAQLAGAVSAKIAGYRDLLGILKVDVRTQLQHVHHDQANTIKRSLYRIQTAAVLRKSNVHEAAEGANDQLKERLFETEQALRRTTRTLEDLQAENVHITTQLQQLATPGAPAESQDDGTHAPEDAGHLLSRVKAQQLDMWREIERLQQEVSLLAEDREVLADKLANTDSILNEQFDRFSAVLMLLSTTLAIPDDLLVAVSDVGTGNFDAGMDQMRALLERTKLESVQGQEFGETRATLEELLAENEGLKMDLQAAKLRVEQVQLELQRRCSSFEFQLQSACSECTAAAEEHIAGSVRSMETRLDRLQEAVDACKADCENEKKTVNASSKGIHERATITPHSLQEHNKQTREHRTELTASSRVQVRAPLRDTHQTPWKGEEDGKVAELRNETLGHQDAG
eukprot:jgi/Ulvmu1/5266/UM022_0060.1